MKKSENVSVQIGAKLDEKQPLQSTQLCRSLTNSEFTKPVFWGERLSAQFIPSDQINGIRTHALPPSHLHLAVLRTRPHLLLLSDDCSELPPHPVRRQSQLYMTFGFYLQNVATIV